MKTQITMLHDAGFDVQSDTYMEIGWTIYSEGPDRAYLVFPVEENGGKHEEIVGLWVLDEPYARETLAAVLGVPDHPLSRHKPWFVRWIKGGELHVKCQWIGIDRGAHLLASLADFDILDRRSHLFGVGE